MIHKYDDIINLEYHGTKRANKMSSVMRGAQFAPFAALNGHEDAIDETARLTSQKVELDNDEKIEISNTLNNLDYNREYIITYFKEDIYKSGGEYISIKSKIKKIDEYNHQIILIDKSKINIYDIYHINKDAND